ncbi:response regulator [Pseudomonas sp. HR96]|uniref:response regulator n=1 Tax=Pseudomonas sp. HR96 TaxID=1027966 RepID=UPI002A761EBF|nr:response regulator [Pseudomonas sp. HR96]WPP00319.1 response regulator [Pseudomonas sp. HR96]
MSDHNILSEAELQALNAAMNAGDQPPLGALVVDDHPQTRETLAEILFLHGISCTTAASAVEALERLRLDKSIGLLITDLRMAPDSGLDLIREIRESDRAALPIIIMSGDAGVKDAIAAMHLSVVDFLLKPIDANLLVTLAKRELGVV